MGFLTFFLAAAATSIAISYIKSRIDPLNDVQDRMKHWPAPQKVVIKAPQIVPHSIPLPCPNAPQTRPECPKCQFCGKEDHVLKVGEHLPLYEDRFHEFKSGGSDSCIDRYFRRYACAFLNRSGGMLWIGIKDNGEISGFNCDSERFDDLRSRFAVIAETQFQPSIQSDMYQVKLIPLTTQDPSSGQSPLSLICIAFHPPTSSKIVYKPTGGNMVSVRALASVRELSNESIHYRTQYGLARSGTAFQPTACPLSRSTSPNLILGETLPRDLVGTTGQLTLTATHPTQILQLFAIIASTKAGHLFSIWLGIDRSCTMLGWEENRKELDELLKHLDDIAFKESIDPALYHADIFRLSSLTGEEEVDAGQILLRLSLLPKPLQPASTDRTTKIAPSPPQTTSGSTKKKEPSKKETKAPATKSPPRLSHEKPTKAQKKATSAPKKATANEKKQNRAQKPKTGKAPVAKAKAKVGAASA